MMSPVKHRDATLVSIRTTVTLDDDIAAAVEQLRREQGVGLSEALNEIARAGLVGRTPATEPVRLETRSMRLRVDVSNVAEALNAAERPLGH